MTRASSDPGPNPDVSVVIVSWDVVDYLAACIESVKRNSSGLEIEIIVVDNASTDGTVERLAGDFPEIRVVANNNNVGFARANNQGFDLARGRNVFILNPDTLVLPEAIRKLSDALDNDPSLGMVGPLLLSDDGSEQLVCARKLPSLLSVFVTDALPAVRLPVVGEMLKRRYLFPYDLTVDQDVEAVSGAAMMTRRKVLAHVGGFGDEFRHCGEDIDLCYRVRRQCGPIRYVSSARVVHFGGRSAQQAISRVNVSAALSVQHYLQRCSGTASASAYKLMMQGIHVPYITLAGIFKQISRRESSREFAQRIDIARGLARWEPPD